MENIIAKIVAELIFKEIKIKSLTSKLFEHGIISKEEANDEAAKLLKDESFLRNEILKYLPDEAEENIKGMINSMSNL